MRVGALEVVTLLDAEGSFARMSEVFASSSSNEPWGMPINAVRRRVLMELAEEGAPVAVAHFPGFGRFVREGDGFGWQPAKEEPTPVE